VANPDKTPLERMRERIEAARRRGTFTPLDYDELDSLLAEVVRLRQERDRAVFLAQHLFQMVPRQTWRDSGGDDGQGHYEGDYHAEKMRDELAALASPDKPPDRPQT
jgi:hypothetical protein